VNRLRNQKTLYLGLIQKLTKNQDLTEGEAEAFTKMFQRCRSQEEQREVFQAMMNCVRRLAEGTDRYAVLARGDLLEADD